MSSIPGAAATEVKIEGVVHEYDRIEGMREDVICLLLNLKNIVFKMEDAQRAVVTIKKSGACTVSAGDIKTPHNVEVLNKDHVLATLTKKGTLDMEITIEQGTGYETASARESEDEEKRFGVIYLDAFYSPVKRVAFQVESTRVGNRTDLDRLVLDVETSWIIWRCFPVLTENAFLARQKTPVPMVRMSLLIRRYSPTRWTNWT